MNDQPQDAVNICTDGGWKNEATICISTVRVSVVPAVPGSYYLDCTGAWTQRYAVLRGVVTDAQLASVTAEITGSIDLTDIALGDVSVRVDSGGFLWSNGRSGMYFAVYGSGQVYSVWVYGSAGRQRVTSALLSEDSPMGSVARYYLKTLGINGSDLMAGNVYMTPRSIQSNFGTVADTKASFTWGETTIYLPQTQPLPEVPQTGMPADGIACVFALVCLGCVLALAIKLGKGRK